jgi:hypothetical protein
MQGKLFCQAVKEDKSLSKRPKAASLYILFGDSLLCPETRESFPLGLTTWLASCNSPSLPNAFRLFTPSLSHVYTAASQEEAIEWIRHLDAALQAHLRPHTLLYRRARHEYPDGSVYTGEWLEAKRQGSGVHTGKGTKEAGLASFAERYEGGWRDDLPHHEGVKFYANGARYEGGFRAGLRHGKGLYVTSEKVYNGDWVADKKKGYGREMDSSGCCYEGEWDDDCKNGVGVMTHRGRTYSGGWAADKHHGVGTLVVLDVPVYNGEWSKGLQHGKGVFTYTDGGTYSGHWDSGKRCGTGVMKYKDGSAYDGEWKDDVWCGTGVINYASGDSLSGTFKPDKDDSVRVNAVFRSPSFADQAKRQEAASKAFLSHASASSSSSASIGSSGSAAGKQDRLQGSLDLSLKLVYDDTAKRLDDAWIARMNKSMDGTEMYAAVERMVLGNYNHPFGALVEEFTSNFCSTHMNGTDIAQAVADVKDFVEAIEKLLLSTYASVMQERLGSVLRLSAIFEAVFPRISQVLMGVYREVHKQRDRALSDKFENLCQVTPAQCFSNPKFYLSGEAEPYGTAIEKLKDLAGAHSPIAKLRLLDEAFRLVHVTVTEYYQARALKIPEIGADASWPIFQYMVIKAAPEACFSQVMMMRDFFNNRLEDCEGFSYRLMVFEATLDLVNALEWGNYDSDGVLVPVTSNPGLH